jgi:Ca2+-binding EF-hand superfamily protein
MKKTLFTLLAIVTSLSMGLAKDSKPKHENSIAEKRNKILEENDLNKDGKLDAAEIDGMIQRKREKHEARHKEFLQKYDTNKNGKLDEDERAKAKSDRLQTKAGEEIKTKK